MTAHTEHGRILDVTEETLGGSLTADTASGATTITVDDAGDFEDDGSGGWLQINGQNIQYDTVDDTGGTIHLLTGLAAAANEGDPVYVWSVLYAAVSTIKSALVVVDGNDDNTDPIYAILSDSLSDLPEGLRGNAGEACTITQVSPDEWEVTAVGGRSPAARGVRFYEDTLVLAAKGSQVFDLTFEPLDFSEHLYWNGVYQPSTEWSRDGKTISVPDASADLIVGDELVMKYAYQVGLMPRDVLPWQATGYHYLQIDMGDTVDRSGTSFDDSSWSIGQASFGSSMSYDGVHTLWPLQTAIWLRRHVTAHAGEDLYLYAHIDNYAKIYWNGTLIVDDGAESGGINIGPITIPGSTVQAVNKLAIRATDEAAISSGDGCLVDFNIQRGPQ